MEKKVYVCTRTIDFGTKIEDVQRYEEGDEIELEDKHADPLLEVGAIKDPAAKEPRAARQPKKVVKAK